MNPTKKEVLNEIIIGYRKVISDRYNFENLQEKYDLPASFDAARIELIKNYFLTYVYPEPAKREELNEAFNSLDSYTENPEKILRILIDSGRILFKYGRHLPKILSAGIKALRSFKTGSEFESQLVENAMNSDRKLPFSKEDINSFISRLSSEKVEQFIENNKALFETLHNRTLMKKIIEIVDHLIQKMQSRAQTYSSEEVGGLIIGRDIVREGNLLFESLEKTEQRDLLAWIIQIETDALNDIFDKEI